MIKNKRRPRTSIELDPILRIEEIQPDNTRVTKPQIAPKMPSGTVPVDKNFLEGSIVTSNPEIYFGLDLIGKSLGLPAQTYTEKDLTDAQLKVIDDQVRYRMKDTPSNEDYFALHPKDTIDIKIDAPTLYPAMYGRKYGNTDIKTKLFTPEGQIESILGNYNAKVYKDGYEAYDTYDFNSWQGQYKGNNSPYAKIRRFAGKHGHTSEDPDSTKNKFSIKRNVNHW